MADVRRMMWADRITAERTLRDYAATAAWEFNAHAKEELWQALAYAFRPCKAIETTSARHASLPPSARILPHGSTIIEWP